MSRMGTNVPKAILSSPGQEEQNEELSMQIKNAAKIREIVMVNATQGVQEIHQNRMKSLRKELDYLKETEWKYEPIDKYIGQP